MLVRMGLLALAVVELVAPRWLVDTAMRLATEDGGPVDFQPWVYAVTRLEGLVILLWVLERSVGRRGDPEA